jgi:hypothetical protein
VLPRPARDLQHHARRRQEAAENLEDRLPVALGGGRVQALDDPLRTEMAEVEQNVAKALANIPEAVAR